MRLLFFSGDFLGYVTGNVSSGLIGKSANFRKAIRPEFLEKGRAISRMFIIREVISGIAVKDFIRKVIIKETKMKVRARELLAIFGAAERFYFVEVRDFFIASRFFKFVTKVIAKGIHESLNVRKVIYSMTSSVNRKRLGIISEGEKAVVSSRRSFGLMNGTDGFFL